MYMMVYIYSGNNNTTIVYTYSGVLARRVTYTVREYYNI